MLRRAMILLALPMCGLLAQATPLHVVITASNNSAFRIVRSTDTGSVRRVGQGRWEITADSMATESLTAIATDSLSRVHVEASEGGRVIASGDGAFVTIRRDAGAVSIESRSRVPSAFAPGDLRRP
jgi:predicted Rdx family selenoprotein